MHIGRHLLSKARKRVANATWPTETQWAMSQPARWRNACLAFAVASNTRGGVVGKSEAQIVREANSSEVPITLRTFKRRVAVLQAYGIVYMDEKRAVQADDGTFSQQASTWILHLDRIMPEGIPLTSNARWHHMTPAEWFANPRVFGCPVNPAKVASPWCERTAETCPFL